MLEKAFAVGAGGIVGQNVRLALSGLPPRVHDVVAGLGGRPITRASLRRLLEDAIADRLGPRADFLDLDRELVERELRRAGDSPGRARTRRASCAQVGAVAAGPRLMAMAEQRSSSSRPGASRSATACSIPSSARCSPRHGPLEHAHLRPPRLPGLRRGARRPLRARRGDAGERRPADRGQRDRLPRGVLDPLPRELVAAALDPLAVRQRAGGGDRRRRRAEGQGPRGRAGRSARAATAAPSTSASAACRGCSSATTTCCSSATTTRAT